MSEPDRAVARADLIAARARTHELLDELGAGLEAVFAATTDANVDDEHDPEGATIAFERSQLSNSIDAARERLRETDAALTRLDTDSYGLCEHCGERISAARLAARPASRRCITCAQ